MHRSCRSCSTSSRVSMTSGTWRPERARNSPAAIRTARTAHALSNLTHSVVSFPSISIIPLVAPSWSVGVAATFSADHSMRCSRPPVRRTNQRLASCASVDDVVDFWAGKPSSLSSCVRRVRSHCARARELMRASTSCSSLISSSRLLRADS